MNTETIKHKRPYVHGHTTKYTESKTYLSWKHMMDKHHKSLKAGGSGIVCERWLHFINFLEDMGIKPEGYVLGRIKNDAIYNLENCRWVTKSESCKTRNDLIPVLVDGKIKSLKEACIDLGLSYTSIYKRVRKYGWSIEEAMNKKIRKWERAK